MEYHGEDPATPASGTMSVTFLATFFVIALLVGGVFLFWHLTGTMVPEMIASVDPTAHALPTRWNESSAEGPAFAEIRTAQGLLGHAGFTWPARNWR